MRHTDDKGLGFYDSSSGFLGQIFQAGLMDRPGPYSTLYVTFI